MARSSHDSSITYLSIRFLIATLFILSVASIARSQEVVVTSHDGIVVRGKIIVRGVDSLKVMTKEGRMVSLANLQIHSIEEENQSAIGAPRPFNEKARIHTDHPIFGLSILSPAGINLIVGYRMGLFGARLTGMHFGKHYGAQFDLLANLDESGDFIHDLYVGIGMADNVDFDGGFHWVYHEWRYTAIGYNVSWKGIYANGALSFGSGDYDTPQLIVQLGFVKEAR